MPLIFSVECSGGAAVWLRSQRSWERSLSKLVAFNKSSFAALYQPQACAVPVVELLRWIFFWRGLMADIARDVPF
jgi:hypothetical protein